LDINSENGYIVRIGQLDSFIVSPEFAEFIKEKYLKAKLDGFLDVYGIPMIVSQEAIDYLNKLSEKEL